MENIASQITRQKLLIEANYHISVDENIIKDYLTNIARELNLRIYGEPIIHSPGGGLAYDVRTYFSLCKPQELEIFRQVLV